MAQGFLSKDRIVAPPGFNRWRIPPASVAIHLCIGSIYSWSIFNPVLTRELGVVASAAADWSIGSVVWVFSVAIVFVGLAAAVAGGWVDRVGPRAAGVAAACLWGSGFVVSSAGIHWHQLWLVYLGYGVLGGCGLGLGYIAPVSTLIRWFPDRRGMATGMAIMGFGGGAMVAAPLKEFLLRTFRETPRYLGPAAETPLATEGGRRFAEVAGRRVEVVTASPGDAAVEGVYVVGSGGTGAAETFLVLGGVYLAVMLAAAFAYRVPAGDWRPEGWDPGSAGAPKPMVTTEDVHVSQAHRTPQFYLLWVMLCFNVTAGIGVIGVAKTMMTDIFGTTLPALVTPAFASTYVLMISVFNMGGRFLWASVSDYIGRRATCSLFFVAGALLYLSIPFAANGAAANPGLAWLVLFYAATMLAFTFYGGGFATIPAYVADVFGTLHVGGIHGRILTAWSVAGVLGPFLITRIRDLSIRGSIRDLAAKVDPADFESRFGAPLASLEELAAARTVTIGSLMELAPPGTPDPTPSLYNPTMFAMAAFLAAAFFANGMMRPVAARRHVRNTHPDLADT